MANRVYHLHSTIELELDDVYDYFEDPALPAEIEDVDVVRRNNTLVIAAVAPEGTVGKYTPTAQLKATVAERRIPDEDADPIEPPSEAGWVGPAEVEQPTKVIEVAAFKGAREAVLQNTALQYPMFEVLRDLSLRARSGELTAIVSVDGELEAIRIADGEERPATIEVTEVASDEESPDGVDWRNNEYID